MITILIISIIYLLIGLCIATIEYWLNSGCRIQLFDVINMIFWPPLSFISSKSKEKLYLFLHPQRDS